MTALQDKQPAVKTKGKNGALCKEAGWAGELIRKRTRNNCGVNAIPAACLTMCALAHSDHDLDAVGLVCALCST